MELFAITAIRRGGLGGSNVAIRRTLAATLRLNVLVFLLPPIRIRHLLILFIPRRTLIWFRAWLVIHKTSVSQILISCDPRRISAFLCFALDMVRSALARSGHDTLIAHPAMAHTSLE